MDIDSGQLCRIYVLASQMCTIHLTTRFGLGQEFFLPREEARSNRSRRLLSLL
jgi:hypothetical protein